MSDEKLNRRDFFRRAAAIGASVAGAGMLLSACKDGGSGAKGGDKSAGGEKAAKGGDKGGGELSCTDTSGLTDGEKKTRESLQYVDKSTKPDKNCKNCSLYTEPKNKGECGGCTVIAGPINPNGYCASWAPKS